MNAAAAKSQTTPSISATTTTRRAQPPQSQVDAGAAKKAPGERVPAFPLTAKITILKDANPKRPGTQAHTKWGLYMNCKTVGDVVEAFKAAKYPRRKAMSALRWDSSHEFIKITQ